LTSLTVAMNDLRAMPRATNSHLCNQPVLTMEQGNAPPARQNDNMDQQAKLIAYQFTTYSYVLYGGVLVHGYMRKTRSELLAANLTLVLPDEMNAIVLEYYYDQTAILFLLTNFMHDAFKHLKRSVIGKKDICSVINVYFLTKLKKQLSSDQIHAYYQALINAQCLTVTNGAQRYKLMTLWTRSSIKYYYFLPE